jgi:hypothetical protein
MCTPTSILEQAQRRIGAPGKWGAMLATTRRCVCVLALMIMFLAVGVGSVPSREAGALRSLPLDPILFGYGLTAQTGGNAAWADTLADADQGRMEACGCFDGVLSTRARFKTH